MNINDARLDKLINFIETYRRRLVSNNGKHGGVEYIATGNENEKIKAPCCHIIEARRGCGKTTFISKALFEEENVLQVYIDCQKYNGIQADTVILQICSDILEEMNQFLNQEEIQKYKDIYINKTKGVFGFIRKKFKKVDSDIVADYGNYISIKKSVEMLKNTIKDILARPEEQKFDYKDSRDNTNAKTQKSSRNVHKKIFAEGSAEGSFPVSELLVKIQSVTSYQNVKENIYEEIDESKNIKRIDTNYSKTVKRTELIDELKICFAKLYDFVKEKYGERIVLFLDDFYQIEFDYQPRILQYFHGIYKESGGAFCFKAVAIPNSVKINYDGQRLFSKKDDFPTIVLNYDLIDMDNLVIKLVKILISIEKNIGLSDNDIYSLFTSGTLYYLVMASGGIPRDFMALFSNTLIHARDRRNEQITKNDLYAIISELKKEKESDREVDLIGFTNQAIDDALDWLEDWVKDSKINVMLYPVVSYKKHEKILKALVNLRYIHIINEHVTPEGKNFEAVGILLDMTLYATSGRLPNYFNMCEFWVKDRHSSKLRQAKIGSFSDEFVNGLERI